MILKTEKVKNGWTEDCLEQIKKTDWVVHNKEKQVNTYLLK